jgi:hypothetical protein
MAQQKDWYQQASSLALTGSANKVGNLFVGGQLGIGPKYTLLDSSTPIILNPALAIVVSTPEMWNNIPGGDYLRFYLKSAFETHAKSMTGFDFSYDNEAVGTPIGHDSQEAKVPTQTKRSQVNPSIVFQEIVGNPIWNIGRRWMFDMNHPDTTMSLMSAQLGSTRNGENQTISIPPFLYSSFSMSMLLLQFDPTGLPENLIDVVYYINMFPTSIGELGIERVHNGTKAMERTWTMTAVAQHNAAIRDMGVQLAHLIRAHAVDYNYATPAFTFDEAARKEQGSITGGLRYDIDKMLAEFTRQQNLNNMQADGAPMAPFDSSASEQSNGVIGSLLG